MVYGVGVKGEYNSVLVFIIIFFVLFCFNFILFFV